MPWDFLLIWVVYRIQTQAFGENILASPIPIWSTTPSCLTTTPPSHTSQYCSVGWLTHIGFYRLPSTSSAKLAASGVCSLPGHISVVAAHSLFYPGRKECTLLQNFGKTTHNDNLLFISVTRTEYCHSGGNISTISRVFTCLHKIVHLTEASTCNGQPICPPRNSLEICHPSSVFIQQYAWGSKSVSLPFHRSRYLYQVRRGELVNLFRESLIIRGRRKAGWVP